MGTCLVSFATSDFEPSFEELVESARHLGADEIRSWRPSMLKETAFYRDHREVFEQKRGAGYWL